MMFRTQVDKVKTEMFNSLWNKNMMKDKCIKLIEHDVQLHIGAWIMHLFK